MKEEFITFWKTASYLSDEGKVDLSKLPLKLKYDDGEGNIDDYEEGDEMAMPLTHILNKLFYVVSKHLG